MRPSRSCSAALALATLIPATTVANPSTRPGLDAQFEPLGRFGQFGLGLVGRVAGDAMPAGDAFAFDGTLRFGKVWDATDRLRPGGFLEVRTVGFDTFEVAIGPQVQIRVTAHTTLQVRAGLGADADGSSYGLAGVQYGRWWGAASVTARRGLGEDRATTVSVNAELTTATLLVPVVVMFGLLGGKYWST